MGTDMDDASWRVGCECQAWMGSTASCPGDGRAMAPVTPPFLWAQGRRWPGWEAVPGGWELARRGEGTGTCGAPPCQARGQSSRFLRRS